VEKAIAERLKSASIEERKLIYATMYDELFRQVPDHPRLTRRADEALTARANEKKFELLREHLTPSSIVAEFAPGDCKLAVEVAKHVRLVYAIDISDQRATGQDSPPNLDLIVYDGYHTDEIPPNSVDVVFSDQFLEHLHPEDTSVHLALAHSILKPGGRYVMRTPHAASGPHDVSQYFCRRAEGFHLKEWTFVEMQRELTRVGFSGFLPFRFVKGRKVEFSPAAIRLYERALSLLPARIRRSIAGRLTPAVCVTATK
jgi:SAM-dependent methyltransferase